MFEWSSGRISVLALGIVISVGSVVWHLDIKRNAGKLQRDSEKAVDVQFVNMPR